MPIYSSQPVKPAFLPIVVSLSGGLTSAYMLRLLLDNYPGHPFHIVFANTGRELKATRDFIREIGRRWKVKITWLEAVINPVKGQGTTYREVTPENCARPEYEAEGPVGRPADWEHPFEAGLAKYGISNQSFPWCSRELKGVILDKWAKEQVGEDGDFLHAIGLRADEDDRSRQDKFFYPLHEWGVTKAQVEAWWAKQPFTLGIKNYQGNCDLCWKKSLRKTLQILAENPRVAHWWDKQEKTFQTMPAGHVRERGGAQIFHHDFRSTETLVAMMEGDLFYRVMNMPAAVDTGMGLGGVDFGLDCKCGS